MQPQMFSVAYGAIFDMLHKLKFFENFQPLTMVIDSIQRTHSHDNGETFL